MRERELLEEVKRRRALADYYYDNFQRHYAKKELSKASAREAGRQSTFLWGTLTAITYAVGLLHNKKLGRHKEIVSFLQELAKKQKDKEMAEGVTAAERIHANFYNDFMDDIMFEEDRQKTERLLKKLAEKLDSEVAKLKR